MQSVISRPGEMTPLTVDLWQVERGQISEREGWLSASEQAWAGKLGVTSEAGRQFLQSRSVLRWILSQYVAVPPAAIQLCFSPTGKPYLDQRVHTPAWQFSWSHSGAMAVAAVTQDVSVGVDIEQIKPRPRARHIARRFFAPADQARLESLAEPEYTQEFLSGWTGLEAQIKAMGGKLFGAGVNESRINQPFQSLRFRLGHDYVGTVVAMTEQPITVQLIPAFKHNQQACELIAGN